MGLLDRFRRRNQDSVLPQEVQEYYQSEKRQKRSVAIALALAALFVTVAVAAGLFFGGRYVYNKIWGDDKQTETAQNDNRGFEEQNNQDQVKDQGTSSTNTSNPNQSQPSPSQGSQNNPAPAPAPSTQPAPAPAPSSTATPALGDENLPRTGDEGM